jgi:hypothetical protein
MERLRLPFLLIAGIILLCVVGAESAANAITALLSALGLGIESVGNGIPYLGLLDGLLVFTVLLMVLPLIVPEGIHARIQGIATLIIGLLAALGGIVMVIVALVLLMTMVSLFLAAPFGTVAYLALFGDFPNTAAESALGGLLLLKLVAGICLILAHQRFLQNKGLVLIFLSSLLANIIVSFLHNIVPGILVSITDALAAIVVAIIAIIWAVILLIASIPAVVKAVK